MKSLNKIKDIDDISKNILKQMDYSEEEIIYKSEIDAQIKMYMFILIFSIIMILCSLIL